MAAFPPQSERSFWSAYDVLDREHRARQARIGCLLTLIFVPAGFSLDWFIYPHQIGTILVGRLLCDVVVLPIFLMLMTAWGRRWVGTLGLLWPLVPAVTIAWMIAITQGAASPYYAGLNLVIIVACVLMPYTWREAAAVTALTMATYGAAVAAHHLVVVPGSPVLVRDLFGNCYFIALTGIITSTAAHWSWRRRVEDFHLRHQLAATNSELQTSYQKLAELDRLRSHFFANISHELRTPLTLIIAPVEDLLARPESLPASATAALGIARQNALRLLRLIGDLLELVRIDAKQQPLAREHMDLGVFARGVVESVRYLAQAKGLTITCVAGATPTPVAGDPSRLEKVLLNLLSNAIKFTPAGGRITVSCQVEGRVVGLAVTDTGRGIPAQELPHIFDRFRQVDGSTTRNYQGAGIGLALVKELIEEQGGTIHATSVLGQGTAMHINLPLAAGTLAVAPVPAPPDRIQQIYQQADRSAALSGDLTSEADEDIALGHGKAVVLVVDDEPDMRHYLVSRLTDAYRVHQCGHGTRAITAVKRIRPDLVLLDMMLPGTDGLGVCRALRADPELADVRIILLTARMDEEVRLAALREGADDFLTKPFSSPELEARVATQIKAVLLQQTLRLRGDELALAIDKRKQAEAMLVHSEKMNALGVLSAGILHEVNNPLNFILTALQVARQSLPIEHPASEPVGDALGGAERMRIIVKDLGAFAHRHQGESRSLIELDGVVALSLRLCAHETGGLAVQVNLDPGLRVCGSQTQLSQVVVNLLINAARACRDPGLGRAAGIAITGRAVGNLVEVVVRDTGIGIPSAHLSHVFEPFFTTQAPGSGTGLGLAICHSIVAAHLGTITVTSQPGEWTACTMQFPCVVTHHVHEDHS